MNPVQHVEFFHKEHFEKNYLRLKPADSLSHFIDFFWETTFEDLWEKYPHGFSDILFPNTGYTYLINLGTPFTMQLDAERFEIKVNGLLPRHKKMECHHRKGNKIFGIKFNISPVLFEKKINFSEYRESIFPLSYLIDEKLGHHIRQAKGFESRVALVSKYYQPIIEQNPAANDAVSIIKTIMDKCYQQRRFTVSMEQLAAEHNISSRTLQRYFLHCMGISGKNAIQLMRIRMAAEQLAVSPQTFDHRDYGYYDHSHFFKHLSKFLQESNISFLPLRRQLLMNLQASKKQKLA